MLFITVQPDGSISEADVAVGSSYEALRAGVQGWIEPMDYAEGLTHYHNEEFLLTDGAPFDQINFTVAKLSGALVYGPVVFTGGIDDEGETRGLSEPMAQLVREMAESVRDSLPDLLALGASVTKPEPSFTITAW